MEERKSIMISSVRYEGEEWKRRMGEEETRAHMLSSLYTLFFYVGKNNLVTRSKNLFSNSECELPPVAVRVNST